MISFLRIRKDCYFKYDKLCLLYEYDQYVDCQDVVNSGYVVECFEICQVYDDICKGQVDIDLCGMGGLDEVNKWFGSCFVEVFCKECDEG